MERWEVGPASLPDGGDDEPQPPQGRERSAQMADGFCDGVAGVALGIAPAAGGGVCEELAVDGLVRDTRLQGAADPSPFASGFGTVGAGARAEGAACPGRSVIGAGLL